MPVLDYKGVVDSMFIAGWAPGDMWGADKKTAVAFYDTALAVCKAESGFDTTADNPSSSAIGLWQIMQSVHKKMIAEEVERWSTEFGKPVDITNPVVNTSCARRLFQSRSWQPWEVYNDGTYRNHLGLGAKAYAYAESLARDPQRLEALKAEYAYGRSLGAAVGGALMPTAGAINDPMGWIGTALAGIASFAAPVGIFLLGVLLLIVGLWIAAGNPTPVKTISKAIK